MAARTNSWTVSTSAEKMTSLVKRFRISIGCLLWV